MSAPRVFTIPASAPFLSTLIRALVDGDLVPGFEPARDPLALARATLFLPTRRACRLARDVFLDVLETDAAILPRIVAIGDIDEDDLIFAEAASGAIAETALELPPALGGFERRMLLARLVLAWSGSAQLRPQAGDTPLVVHSPAAALALAGDLCRLIDDMTIRQVPWDGLDRLVPETLDPYWQLTLEFLKIARVAWPAILTERGAVEDVTRRDRMIEAEAMRLAAAPDGPVIAAGSTASMPATAQLLGAVARLPHGAVVLPGLDRDLDEPSWDLIAGVRSGDRYSEPPAVSHPQFAMQAFLQQLGIDRGEVAVIGTPGPHGRERLISEAMRPAAATELWAERLDEATRHAALADVTMIEAANPEEEALAIAVALRETVEAEGKSAALVTPDRALARRVTAALARWKVAVDDTGGDRLADTPAGVFARLVADAALEGLPPVPLLALLKHPLCRICDDIGVAALERAVLRGPRPRAGCKGLAHALATFRVELNRLRRNEPSALHRADPRTSLTDAELDAAAALVQRLGEALAPLEEIEPRPWTFGELAAKHHAAIAALSRDETGRSVALTGNDGNALLIAFDDIVARPRGEDIDLRPTDYAELFALAIGERVVRRPGAPGTRVCVFGPLEARLTRHQRVVLGGLVENVWPPETRSDPWLSRPMRLELGLDLPERRVGLSAHDIAQLMGAPEVILTRSAKLAGAPTVPSRFVQRLAAVSGAQWKDAMERGERYLRWARDLDRPAAVKPVARPEPKPPRAARPNRLSVTEIEHWLRDPYTIYAKHVLRLAPLDAVDTPPGARDRGTVIHGAIGDFTEKFAAAAPAHALDELIALGTKHFAALEDYPEARAFWWPRYLRIARWFASWDAARRSAVAQIHAEIRGEISIPVGERSFKLTTRADRIERLADGGYAILDYKTGSVPTDEQVRSGLAPQLTLEGAILRKGGFKEVPAGVSLDALVYVSLKGGEPAGLERVVKFKDDTAQHQADFALARLAAVVARFEKEDTPYRSLVSPMWKTRYGDYDHLSRVKEWSVAGGDDIEPGGPE